jgi:hypothetical protein
MDINRMNRNHPIMKFPIALVTAALATTIDTEQAGTPNKNEVYVKEITYNGSGCPKDSVAIALSEDLTTFTLLFSNFIAQSGKNIAATENRKNCQVNVDIRYPQGWSYSIATIDYRGYIGIPKGVSAVQKANYYFAGSTSQVSAESKWNGPLSQDYLTRNQIPVQNTVWSQCGKVERGNVNAQVRLEGDLTKSAQITVDSIDGTVKQVYGLQWLRC